MGAAHAHTHANSPAGGPGYPPVRGGVGGLCPLDYRGVKTDVPRTARLDAESRARAARARHSAAFVQNEC